MGTLKSLPGKTLFISDLDGTLLDRNACLPKGYAERINALTSRGAAITYATARTVRSVNRILSGINFTLPIALMNGVLIRDMKKNSYVRAAELPKSSIKTILSVMDEAKLEPFMYTLDREDPLDGDPMKTYYRNITSEPMRAFRDERVVRYGKPFLKLDDLTKSAGACIYFCVIGSEGSIKLANEKLRTTVGISTACYRDSYDEVWYLEIFSDCASKKRAVEFLRQYTGAERIVCFGDNLNDLPMFEAADISVAVENAADEVRLAADHITNDVVGFIEKMCDEHFIL